MSEDLVARLEAIAEHYDPSDSATQFDYWLKRLQAEAVGPWLVGRHILELGCATGELTGLLAPLAERYDVVEGSPRNIAIASARVPSARYIEGLWEAFEPDAAYSDIVMFNALEHATEPVPLLRQVTTWLEPGGRVHIVVPNGLSLHRLVGVELGLQAGPLDLTEGDRAQGHLRNYTIDSLGTDVTTAGLQLIHWQGLFLKIMTNRQMVGWDWEFIHSVNVVGQRLPQHCAELFLVARPR